MDRNNEAVFTLNGVVHTVGKEGNGVSLLDYIRNTVKLKGTKYMCREGGCGACLVALRNPSTTKLQHAVPACLVPVLRCHGMVVTTVEGVGSTRTTPSRLQTVLANMSGSQCGYCSPGMVISAHCLFSSNKTVSMEQVEDTFTGNICRCTGYRPILDAYKSLAMNATEDLKIKVNEIEECARTRQCNKCPGKGKLEQCRRVEDSLEDDCPDFVEVALASPSLRIAGYGSSWYKASNLNEIFEIFDMIDDQKYLLVGGNTGQGLYPQEAPVMVDVSSVSELSRVTSSSASLQVGAGVTLTDLRTVLVNISNRYPRTFTYCSILADHVTLIASPHIRNIGTVAGNLSLKHQHNDFPSDLLVILETVGAGLQLREKSNIHRNMSLPEFLSTDMKMKVICNVTLRALSSSSYQLSTFKIMPRASNSLAYLNCGFLYPVTGKNKTIGGKPSIVFGGVSPNFIHADKTEGYLAGKISSDKNVLKSALKILNEELKFKEKNGKMKDYKTLLSLGLFYKSLMRVNSLTLSERMASGAKDLERGVSSGRQDFQTDKKTWPVGQPLPQADALLKATGEAVFVDDLPTKHNELYGALVLTTVGPADLDQVDPSEALEMKGVIAYYGAHDIPGENSIAPPLPFVEDISEELFCSGKVMYAGQVVGMVVAVDPQLASKAARLVRVSYKNRRPPLLSVKEVLASKQKNRIKKETSISPNRLHRPKVEGEIREVSGELSMGGQYHYHMETLSCCVEPLEDGGFKIYPSSQWPQINQACVARLLNIPYNGIITETTRMGGAFGAKATRTNIVCGAAALAAHRLGRPVRLQLPLHTNMRSVGKRSPSYVKYKVEVNDECVISKFVVDFYTDKGCTYNDPLYDYIPSGLINCYNKDVFTANFYSVKTDTPTTVYMRAPGNMEGTGTIEQIMDHVAFVLNKDPTELRMKNIANEELTSMINELISTAEYNERLKLVDQYNKENRWKKKGISLTPMVFPIEYVIKYHSTVSIYSGDGTVVITHGGTEMGQGLNIKVAQICAHALELDLDFVKVLPNYNFISPNNFFSGGSWTSEAVGYATLKACNILLDRLKPVKDKMKNPTWAELIQQAYSEDVDLQASYFCSSRDSTAVYPVYGVTVCEIETDVLTGQMMVRRCDILEDVGQSNNPAVDIGQVEGAFIMGLGYYTSEQITYQPDTGALCNDSTWTYNPPTAKDIPIDLRVYLRRNSVNNIGLLTSKGVGEPAVCMSVSVLLALRKAITSARKDAGLESTWFPLDAPCTRVDILLTSGTSYNQFEY